MLLRGAGRNPGGLHRGAPADAQSLVYMYRSARYQALVQRVFAEHGRAARPMPPEPAPLVTDSMRAKFERIFPPPPPPEAPPRMVVRKWHHIPRLGRPWFERRFGSGGWSFLGSDDNVTSLDTTFKI